MPRELDRDRRRSPVVIPEGTEVLRIEQAAAFCGMKSTAFWKARKQPGFPHPVPLGVRARGFFRKELQAWLQLRRQGGAGSNERR